MAYPLQAASLNKIPKHYLDILDVSIRESSKGIIGLPVHYTPNSMLYSSRNFRGLDLMCARKEVSIQHYSIVANKLDNVNDDLFQLVYNCRFIQLII